MERLTGLVRRCVEDYSMIDDGDEIAVGVSGGKDSLTLLCALAKLRTYYPKKFNLHAMTLSMGYESMDFSGVAALCGELDVPYTLLPSKIGQLIFEERKESNPCALCAKMRRGALHAEMQRQGIRKIALAHHYDDAIETFLMNLLYNGRIGCFEPVTYMGRTGITQIRPLLYVGEGTIRNVAARYKLPVVKNACPMDHYSKREDTKKLIHELSGQYPDLRTKIFGAMQRLPVEGWKPETIARRPLPDRKDDE